MCHISSDVCVFFFSCNDSFQTQIGIIGSDPTGQGCYVQRGPVRLLDSALQRPAEAVNTDTELLKYSVTSEGHRQTAESMEY